MNTLLLITFNGARYGLWEDALNAVRGALQLHHLPLSPPVIAGITLLDERSAVIADLAACLGYPPMNNAQNGTFLIIDFNEKIAGFGVKEAVERVEHSAELALAVPAMVRTQIVDTCVVINGSVVPIINIRALHDRLKQGSLEMPQAEDVIAPLSDSDSASSFSVRAFTLGDERFCIKAEGTGYEAIARERIAVLPVKNGWLAGITIHDHAVLPLVRLDAFLGREPQVDRRGMVIAGTEGCRYGLLVDEDLGVIEQQNLRISGLPALVRRQWMKAAAVSKGTVYPLIEADRIISHRTEEGEREIQHSFSPASEFMHRFRKNEVDIVEFSLLGATHAVPKEEAGDDLQLLPITPIPHTIELVMGVAELDGELLPVLDLAAVFGRSSAVNVHWRMIRVANGDFNALFVTEEVRGVRRLSLEDQKQLPLALPHQVLYGCYLDAAMVRLIMNVQALAVHFEKAAVRELVTSLSAQMDAPAVKSSSLPPETASAVIPEAVPQVSDAVSAPQPVPADKAPAEPRSVVATDHRDAVAAKEEEGRQAAQERERLTAEKAREEEKERREAEQRLKEEEARRHAAEQKRLQEEQEARQRTIDEQRVAEERVRKQAEEHARLQAEEEARKQERETARRLAAEKAQKRQAEEADRQVAEQAPITDTPAQEARPPEEATGQHQIPVEHRKSAHWTKVAVLAAALILVLLYVLTAQVKRPETPVIKKELSTVVPKPSASPVEAKKESPETVRKKMPEPAMPAPLYLTVPPDRVVPAQNIYIVVKGDTLWGIAKRFTGDPLNYPRVAKDNSIATPDLIFPGQKIKLVQDKR